MEESAAAGGPDSDHYRGNSLGSVGKLVEK
jgi:hypothetical protein